MKKNDWIEKAFRTAVSMANDEEFVTYQEAVADNIPDIIKSTIDIVGEGFADPMSSMVIEKGLEKEFARFIEVLVMHVFHIGWIAGSGGEK